KSGAARKPPIVAAFSDAASTGAASTGAASTGAASAASLREETSADAAEADARRDQRQSAKIRPAAGVPFSEAEARAIPRSDASAAAAGASHPADHEHESDFFNDGEAGEYEGGPRSFPPGHFDAELD